LGDFREVSSQPVRLIAVGQGLLYASCTKVILAATGQGSNELANDLLSMTMLLHIVRLKQIIGLIQSAVGQGTFSLFDF
jgi:hypothetical protein